MNDKSVFNRFEALINEFSKQVTWADFVLFTFQRTFIEFAKKSISDYPALEKHHKIMMKIPECEAYWAKHGNDRMTFFKYNQNGIPTFSP